MRIIICKQLVYFPFWYNAIKWVALKDGDFVIFFSYGFCLPVGVGRQSPDIPFLDICLLAGLAICPDHCIFFSLSSHSLSHPLSPLRPLEEQVHTNEHWQKHELAQLRSDTCYDTRIINNSDTTNTLCSHHTVPVLPTFNSWHGIIDYQAPHFNNKNDSNFQNQVACMPHI